MDTTHNQDRPKKSSGGLYNSSLPIIRRELCFQKIFRIKIGEGKGEGGAQEIYQHAHLREKQSVD